MKRTFSSILIIISLIGVCFYVKKFFILEAKYERFFITLDQNNIPSIEMKLQGKPYLFKIYLGWSRFPLYLSRNLLSQLDKKPNGTEKIDGIEHPIYFLPQIEIDDLVFKDVAVMETDPDKDKSLNPEEQIAKIGLKFFQNKNLLVDFENSTIITCNDLNKLKQIGYSIEDMTKTAFEFGRKGLFLNVETDLGLLKMKISSENTYSLIRRDLTENIITSINLNGLSEAATSIFSIGGKNFGSRDLLVWEFSKDFGIDGYIGMDFLRAHVMYFDFINRAVYVGDDYL